MAKHNPKQMQVPGTEYAKGIPEVDAAAAAYVEARDERCKLSKKEKGAAEFLREIMMKNGLDAYEAPCGLVKLKTTRKAEVDTPDEDEDPADVDIPISLDEAKANRRKAQRGTQDRGAPVEP